MTKKDYELIANEINVKASECQGSLLLSEVIEMLSMAFEQDNPNFNRSKFEEACYEGKHIRKAIKG